MKRLAFLLLLSLLLVPFAISQPQASHEETYIRATYAKISYAMQVHVLADMAFDALPDGKLPSADDLPARLHDSEVTFTLSNFRIGAIADIQNERWTDLLTPESRISAVLEVTLNGRSYKDNDRPPVGWCEGQAAWTKPRDVSDDPEFAAISQWSVRQMLDVGAQQFTYPDVVYTRFASVTVTTSFEGRTVGPYKALFLFGTNSKSEEVVAPEQFVIGNSGLFAAEISSLYPQGLLRTRLRDISFVKKWFILNAVSSSSCSAGKAELCCSGNRCGRLRLRSAGGVVHAPSPSPQPPSTNPLTSINFQPAVR